jgi:hypothetical protein
MLGTTNPNPVIKVRRDNPINSSFVSGGSDTCGTATAISGPGPFNGDNIGASLDGPNSCATFTADVWYDWTAPGVGGSYDFSLCGSSYDTEIAVYDGSGCVGALLACDDDDFLVCGSVQSRVTVPGIVAGNVYKVQVGGWNGNTGTYTLNIYPTPPPPSCPCVGAPPEGEANCGLPTDTFDGGCNYTPVVYASLACGGSVCGNGAFNGSYRDTDWYQFTIPVASDVTWTVTSEFNSYIFILDNNCPPSLLAFAQQPACTPEIAVANLNPGTYVAWCGPDFSQVFACGTSDSYLGQLSSVAAPTCPCVGAPPEGEANCGLPTDTFDGGCNYTPVVYASLACGGSVCGNGAFNGSYRDTDWYQFTIPVASDVTWTVTSEFNSYIFILDNNCPPSLLAFAQQPACTPEVAFAAALPAGTYVAWCGPDFSQVFPCGTNDSYLGQLTCAPVLGSIGEFCAGDANAGCPCSNPGSGPGDGCHWNPAQDPTLRGGHLTSVGNPVASLAQDVVNGANRVRLNCEGHRPLSGSIVAVSLLMQGHVGPYVTYGAGRRCIASPFKRVFYFQPTLSNETAPNDTTMPTESISHRSQVTGETLNPGDVRAYQLLYRDPTGYCSATFNASSGIEIVWGP